MRKTRRIKNTTYFWRYLIAIILALTVSTIASFFYFKPKFAFKSSFIEEIESRRLKTKPQEDKKDSPWLYQPPAVKSAGNGDEHGKDMLLAAVEDAIKKYIQPYNAKLLDLYMDKNSDIYVDFSDELRKNFNGDASEERQIIAGLYKSIKTNVPDFKLLRILINGKEAESFGGHIDISGPIGEAIEKPSGEKIEGTI